VYRVRLPGNPVLGEGKPENQNHAMIFPRAEFVQTIDMNQEGYFEEALKMRNALQEFAKQDGPLPTTILGLREHIFTARVSSLANYMALQETSFVTLGQRVLTKPLRIRLFLLVTNTPFVEDKLVSKNTYKLARKVTWV
jgi:callose synthase